MEDYYKCAFIEDENKRKGIFQIKDKVYNKAWYHRNIPRWNPSKYGEKGQNIFANILNDDKIEFISIKILEKKARGVYNIDKKDLIKFYNENKNTKDIIFGKERILFPLSICKKKEI